MRKIIFAMAIVLSLNIQPVSAQEEQPPEELKLDTEIRAEDLGVGKARVLPGSPLYGFKNVFRGIREGLARNPVRKAELQLKHANEKMVEAKQLIEEKKTDKAQQLAVKIIGDVNDDFGKIARQSENFVGAEKFLDKMADNSLKHQVVLQRLEEQVPEAVFTKIEESRQRHLENFGQVMTKTMGDSGQIGNFLPKIVANQKGSDFKELKAVGILKELEDKASPEQKEALRMAQQAISQSFEQRFASMPQEARQERFQNYVEFMPGNPVRQFEALETMKQNFQSPEAIQQMELAKDKAVQKFEDRFVQFQGEEARSEFMAPWTNGDPEGLRTMAEMEMRIEPAPRMEQFQQFQQDARDNFRDRFRDNPEALRENQTFQKMVSQPDIVDLKLSQDLTEVLPSNNFFRESRDQATQKFIENVQKPSVAGGGGGFIQGPPVPGGLKVLQDVRNRVPLQARQGIDRAMERQVQTIERHIEKIDNPETFDRYKQQVEQDRTAKQQVERFAPKVFQIRPAEPRIGGEGGPSPRPVVPFTEERAKLFEGINVQPRQIEQPPVQQTSPEFQPKTIEQAPEVQSRTFEPAPAIKEPAPVMEPVQIQPMPTAPAPSSEEPQKIFPNLWRNFLGAVAPGF